MQTRISVVSKSSSWKVRWFRPDGPDRPCTILHGYLQTSRGMMSMITKKCNNLRKIWNNAENAGPVIIMMDTGDGMTPQNLEVCLR